MAPETKAAQKHFAGLPLTVVSPVDLGRMLRELEALDAMLDQEKLRAPNAEVKLPKTSRFLDQTVEMNKLDLTIATDRAQLQEFLEITKSKAPILHISFGADPSPSFIEKLMVWLRKEIHPLVLLTIGLQPNLGAGCVVRTTNKYFDFSLRQHFLKNRELLMQKLREK